MVFSFFKKKDTDEEVVAKVAPVSVRPTSASKPAAAAPSAAPVAKEAPVANTSQQATASSPPSAAEQAAHEHHGDGLAGIEVTVGDSHLSPAEEQVAIMHANQETAESIPVMCEELAHVKGKQRLEAWLMLFELYQQTGDRAAYDALGLEFVVEFEKTPPIWRKREKMTAKAAPVAGNHCQFGTKLTAGNLDKELAKFRQAVTQIDTLRVDFSKVKEIDFAAAAEILSIWQMAKKVPAQRLVLGGANIVKLLSSQIETGRNVPVEAPFWLLLIELHQAMGQLEEFENLAIEYAITFEVSPPSWDPRFASKPAEKAAVAEEEAKSAQANPLRDGLQLVGEITSQHAEGLNAIREYAKSAGHEVLLDFGLVDRVDFECTGQFLNLFMEIMQQGKTIRIVQVNELVLAMLRLMSVTEFVTAERRKS